ncbi:MAG TPA: acetolactate synthase large subunit, partial [Acidimicrobiales bacterium]|nr:acetolactate synthase large subunit [Acidimicrobiales bacterium]
LAGSRVARTSGARLMAETFPAVLERGEGVPPIERLAYLGEMVADQLRDVRDIVLVGAGPPVAFFAYPNRPGSLVPDGCEVHVLASPGEDAVGALEALAEALDAGVDGVSRQSLGRPDRPTGALTPVTLAAAVGAVLPEGAVVSDEANTGGFFLPGATAGAPRHDWMSLTGGAIGQGLPLATGAAVACPGRRVLCLEADGSAMYTFQALWTQAREGLDVTTVILSNGSYAILELELLRVGAEASGPRARAMLELDHPSLDFVALARGMGVPVTRATTAEEFTDRLEAALSTPGPNVVEAMIGRGLGL